MEWNIYQLYAQPSPFIFHHHHHYLGSIILLILWSYLSTCFVYSYPSHKCFVVFVLCLFCVTEHFLFGAARISLILNSPILKSFFSRNIFQKSRKFLSIFFFFDTRKLMPAKASALKVRFDFRHSYMVSAHWAMLFRCKNWLVTS